MAEASRPLDENTAQAVLQLQTAQLNVKIAGFIGIACGVFALVFILGWAVMAGAFFFNITVVAFLSGGAVSLAIGLGLLNFSEGARSAGAAWYLAWGLLNVVTGFITALSGIVLIGIFSLALGTIMLVLAAIISAPPVAFLCRYLYGEIDVERLLAAAAVGAAEGNEEMKKWLAPLLGAGAGGSGAVD